MTENLPERINVTRVITYMVPEVVKIIAECNDCETAEVTLEDVVEKIEEWSAEEFPGVNLRELIYTNENGEEL